jgi:hypothetical protein
MKQILFLCCCFLAAMSAAQAQIMPEQHDSTYYRKEADAVVQNAPLILRVRGLKAKALRGSKDEAIIKRQYLVLEVFKGNAVVGDTLEIEDNLGQMQWRPDGTYMPYMHYQYNGPTSGVNAPYFIFCNDIDYKTPTYYKNSKGLVSFYSDKFASMAIAMEYEEANPDIKNIIQFNHLWFGRENDWINYLNRMIAPKERVVPKKQNKKAHSKKK